MLGELSLFAACIAALAFAVQNIKDNGLQVRSRFVTVAAQGLAAVFGLLAFLSARNGESSANLTAASLLWVLVSLVATVLGGSDAAGASRGGSAQQPARQHSAPASAAAVSNGKHRTSIFPAEGGRTASPADIPELEQLLYADKGPLRTHIDRVIADISADVENSKTRASTRGGPAHEPIDDYAIGRFLLAAKYEDAKASQNIKDYIGWRHQISGALEPPMEWLDTTAVVMPFEDRFGRPVVFIRAKYMDPKTVNMELFEQGFCATLDAVIQHCSAKRVVGQDCSANPLDQYICCIDTAGAGYSNFSMDAVKTMQRVATTRYAERVAKMYILNASFVVRTVWGSVKPLLLKRTQNNIQTVERSQVSRTVRELLGDTVLDILPAEYGGNAAPWPGPEDAASLEDKAGVLAAKAWIALGNAPAWAIPSEENMVPVTTTKSQNNSRRARSKSAPSCFAWCNKR